MIRLEVEQFQSGTLKAPSIMCGPTNSGALSESLIKATRIARLIFAQQKVLRVDDAVACDGYDDSSSNRPALLDIDKGTFCDDFFQSAHECSCSGTCSSTLGLSSA